MAEISQNIWWIVLAGSILVVIFIGLIIISVMVSNRKLLHLQQEKLEEIRKSEKMYADLFNNVSDLVYIHQFDGVILKINNAAQSILGYSPEELIGKHFQKIFDIPNSVFYSYIHSLDNKEVAKGTLKLKSRIGEERIFEYQNSIVKEYNKPKAIRGIARDVTERIKAEEELRRKDTLLTSIANASIILLVNPDHLQAINQALKILGEATKVDRVYVFENHRDSETNELLMSQKYEWCREGIEPQIDNPLLQNLPYSSPYAAPLFNKVIKGEIYSGIVRQMSLEERDILEPQGIKSILIIPIFIGELFWGFIGFDDCTREREWSDSEKAVLKTAAGSIGGLIGLMLFEKQLKETNIFLSSILESSILISIFTTDLGGIIKYWNSGSENILGYKANEILGFNIIDKLIDESDKISIQKIKDLTRIAREKLLPQVAELVFRHKDGTQLWMNLTASPLVNDIGEITGLLFIGEDITQRKITELALIQNEEMFRNVWENSADGMRLVDEEARIKLVNKAFMDLVEMPYEKLIGQNYNVCYLDQNLSDLEKFRENIRTSNIPNRQSTTIKLWNGKEIPVEISNSFIDLQNNKRMLLSIFRDISEQKEYERKIKLSEEKYRRLALHLQSVREDERTKIAREIHDELGQQLTGLYFEFSSVRTMRTKRDTELEEVLDRINDLIDQLISSVQRISSELRPAILDDLGLIPAIEWEVSQFQKRTNILTELNIGFSELNLSKSLATVIFRILQESLTNVARHSKANKVSIDLNLRNDNFIMEINDNGVGISEEKLSDPHSIGLIGMKERAYACKGELIIESKPNKGTKIIFKLPLNGEVR